MIYVAFVNPGLQVELLESIGKSFTEGPLAAVGSAYGGGQVWNAMLQFPPGQPDSDTPDNINRSL
jgi:hypothetical protein